MWEKTHFLGTSHFNHFDLLFIHYCLPENKNQTHLQYSGDQKPVPLKVLLVVEDVTIPQVQHKCFFCVLYLKKKK